MYSATWYQHIVIRENDVTVSLQYNEVIMIYPSFNITYNFEYEYLSLHYHQHLHP